MYSSLATTVLLLLSFSDSLVSRHRQDDQFVIAPLIANEVPERVADEAIIAALQTHADPVDALVSLHPEAAAELSEPKLIQAVGQEAAWMTEGDKLRLRRDRKKFMDITDHRELYDSINATAAGKAHLPELSQQRLVKPLFSKISAKRMHDDLEHLTSFYNRLYNGPTGEKSSQWLHNHIAGIIAESPFHSHISLEYFTHTFPQSSIIARFEPKVRDFSKPLTILGAHQDSANYLFPLLPAPGADDDGSGSITILEAFRVLAESGYIPYGGPVEFHWYAAEEAGNLGSGAIAAYKKKEGATIGAMMEFDATGFISRKSTESIGLVKTDADAPLTAWAVELSTQYISIPTSVYDLPPNAGSDYMSYTKLGYPAIFATEGFPEEYNPYFHTANDTMDVNDESGWFSIDHMARFSELAIAFAIEQAGWDNGWR